MFGSSEGEHNVRDMETASRAELPHARAALESQISELSYGVVFGGLTQSGKPALLERLKSILAGIDRKLAEIDG